MRYPSWWMERRRSTRFIDELARLHRAPFYLLRAVFWEFTRRHIPGGADLLFRRIRKTRPDLHVELVCRAFERSVRPALSSFTDVVWQASRAGDGSAS